MNTTNSTTGKVIIAGAGPGDPELLTLKALRWLQRAEVIITDRLVSPIILEEYANKKALILHVGKQCRKGASTPQPLINELLVDYAAQGKLVVRLKGGDVSFFSNVFDELQTLVENQIPYEIIPGITAASGAAAYAGIPLTARNYSNGVRFLTYYKADQPDDEYWKELAQTRDTLVFYMSSETIDSLVGKLILHNIDPATHIAVIEQATTPLQNVHSCSIHDYARIRNKNQLISPTLLIIGKVAALHDQFRWLENTQGREYYFDPVSEKPRAEARA